MKTAGQLASIWFFWACWHFTRLPSFNELLVASAIVVFIAATIHACKAQ